MSLLYSTGANASGSLLWPMLFFLAPAVGPRIGGVLLQAADRRVLFLINVPLGTAAALVALRHRAALPADRPAPAAHVDVAGFPTPTATS